ncbi:MAG TPA: hypothetical protein VFV58_21680 [Blastocatellia bacterium]|nr:hypothetical protein [Blastocatellia bacterium]
MLCLLDGCSNFNAWYGCESNLSIANGTVDPDTTSGAEIQPSLARRNDELCRQPRVATRGQGQAPQWRRGELSPIAWRGGLSPIARRDESSPLARRTEPRRKRIKR